jgi:hypothetical protein
LRKIEKTLTQVGSLVEEAQSREEEDHIMMKILRHLNKLEKKQSDRLMM